jgi:hypothetical protein
MAGTNRTVWDDSHVQVPVLATRKRVVRQSVHRASDCEADKGKGTCLRPNRANQWYRQGHPVYSTLPFFVGVFDNDGVKRKVRVITYW